MKKNELLLQGFEWNLPNDGEHWTRLQEIASWLAEIGFSMVWIPPAYKGAKGFGLWRDEHGDYVDASYDVGYGSYDLYDLGEFDQNGTVRTKYGTKEQLEQAIQSFKQAGLGVIADIVLNHKIGNDEDWELVDAFEVDPLNRNKITSQAKEIKATTKYDFTPRNNKYSDFKWNWKHFTGTDHDINHLHQYKIMIFKDKKWNWEVDSDFGNFDYLLGADIDHSNPVVRNELIKWGKWFTDILQLDGYRLDVVKHINFGFMKKWLEEMYKHLGKKVFAVGEYPTHDVHKLLNYIKKTNEACQLFDFPLQRIFHEISHNPSYDLCLLKNEGLLSQRADLSVTFVDNHDTQPNQAMPKWVEKWFKLHAYAFILLRQEGTPSVFWGDLFGIQSCDRTNSPAISGMGADLIRLIQARKNFSYGIQHDYWVNSKLIGWTREGDLSNKSTGCAVLMNTGTHAQLRMYVGKSHAGERWTDWSNYHTHSIVIDHNGYGSFPVKECSVSVWVPHPLFRKRDEFMQLENRLIYDIHEHEVAHLMIHADSRACRIIIPKNHFDNHQCFIHFRLLGHNWTSMPVELIESIDYREYLEVSIPLYESSGIEFCLTDGHEKWDNYFNQNYKTQRDCITVDHQGLRTGTPY